MRKVLFYLQANKTVGLGHLVRCNALAYECKNIGLKTYLYSSSCESLDHNSASNFDILRLPSLHSRLIESDLLGYVQRECIDLVVFDDYAITNTTLARFKKYTKILSFHRIDLDADVCDIIVYALPFSDSKYYCQSGAENYTDFLLGPQYAVLRSKLLEYPKVSGRAKTNKVLVTLGGAEHKSYLIKIIHFLCNQTIDYDITVLTAKNSSLPRYISSNSLIQNKIPIKVLEFNDNPFKLFMDSDFVITAGGMTTYELVYLGLPMIIISTADNQINLAIAWDRLGVAKYFGPAHDLTQENFDSQFSLFINQMPDYKATDTVDGKGALRVARSIHNCIVNT